MVEVLIQTWSKVILIGLFSLSFMLFFYIKSFQLRNNKAIFISRIIKDASYTYLAEQNKVILAISALIMGLFYYYFGLASAMCFVVGSLGSMISGIAAMVVSVHANIATVSEAEKGLPQAFFCSFIAGAGASIYLNALGLLSILFCLNVLNDYSLSKGLLAFSVGANLVSIFARLGGGIFTKGADVGADMVGKVEQSLAEDDARNPAVIADNVGDNVGDCAGMAADLFESYVVTIASTILFNPSAQGHIFSFCVLGLASCVVPITLMNYKNKPWEEMSKYFNLSCFLFISSLFGYQYLFGVDRIIIGCVCIGVLCVGILLKITSYYTSSEHRPVKLIVEGSNYGSGTNVIAGLAMGYESTVLPILVIMASLMSCYYLYGIFGITLCSIGIAALSPAILTMDILGPISDNAGGIAEMAGLPENVREVTDELDSIGNTTKAVTKGYAIGSAIFAILVMFCSYQAQLAKTSVGKLVVLVSDPLLFVGLFVGATIPLLFSGISMLSVGKAAEYVVQIVRNQIKSKPGIIDGSQTPDYNEVIKFLTRFSIQSMIIPALFPIFVTVFSFLGVNHVLGLTPAFLFISSILLGTAVVGSVLSIFMVTAGGSFDNAKKFIEKQGLKNTEVHKAAVTGDTIGDPFKDTTGPSLNSVIKLVSLVCILFSNIYS